MRRALAEADVVVARERADLLGQQRREGAVGGAVLDFHHLAVGQVAAHGVAGAHDLARHAVEHFQPLDVAGAVAGDARGLAARALLVDESAAVGELLRRVVHLAQPAERLGRLRLRRAGAESRGEREDAPADHRRGSSAGSDTVRT